MHTLIYNKRGDMTSDGKLYTYVYDAFGRLRFIKNLTTGNVIEEYTYNALNQRVGQHYDVNANGSVGSEDPWLNFVYDDKWRIVATVRGSGGTNGNQTIESSPKELFVYHNAGLGGFGSSSYIDSVILVDQDNTNGLMIGGSAGASDGTLESRRFIMQNWRADVVCTASATGAPLERVRYSAYGVPTLVRVADYNQDGGLDYNDYDAFYADWEEQTGIAADLNLDGVISMADHDLFAADYDTNPTKIGRTHQSAYGVRKGYAGYENDGVISRFSHVRYRVYDAENGRWDVKDRRRNPRRDMYVYAKDNPVKQSDLQDPRKDPARNPDNWTHDPNDPDPSHWNCQGNCFRYATCSPNDDPAYLKPDGISADIAKCYTCDEMRLATKSAGAIEPLANGECPKNSYKIALLAWNNPPICDFHYMRQDVYGTWSDKNGCADPREIYPPVPFAPVDDGQPGLRRGFEDPQTEWSWRLMRNNGDYFNLFCGYLCWPFQVRLY